MRKQFGRLLSFIAVFLLFVSCSVTSGNPADQLNTSSQGLTGGDPGLKLKLKMSGNAVAETALKSLVFLPAKTKSAYVGVGDALITVIDTNFITNQATSDSNGYFEITNLDPGPYQLVLQKTNGGGTNYWAHQNATLSSGDLYLGEIYLNRNPWLSGVIVNGITNASFSYWSMSNNQTVDITILARDPNNQPLQFIYHRFRRNSLQATLQNWSSSDTFSYSILPEDAVSGFGIWVGVKNADGLDFDSSTFGDMQIMVGIAATNDLMPAYFNSVVVRKAGVITTTNTFRVGDTIDLELNAADPKSLPLEYQFTRFRQNSMNAILQTWSSSNTMSYTFVEEDAVSGFSFFFGVRNNDGVFWDGDTFGDAQRSLSLTVKSDKEPSQINSVVVQVAGTNTSQRSFYVGDTVTIAVLATDPLGLPMQYSFNRFRNNSYESTVQGWSSATNMTYTFVAADAVSGFSFFIGVKNNDGVDADSSLMGDDQASVSFQVSDF